MTANVAGVAPATGIEALAGRTVADLLSGEYARRREKEIRDDGAGARLAPYATPANLSRLQLLLEHVASGAPVSDPLMRTYAQDVARDAGRLCARYEALAAAESRAAWDREQIDDRAPIFPRPSVAACAPVAAAVTLVLSFVAVATAVGITVARLVWLALPAGG